MLPEVLQKGLSKEQQVAGLYLTEDGDHTLVLMQRQPDAEHGIKQLPKVRAVFSQGVSILALRAEAQKWVGGEPAAEQWFAGCEKPLHSNPDDSN